MTYTIFAPLSDAEAARADEGSRALAKCLERRGTARLNLGDSSDKEVALPDGALHLLATALECTARGEGVQVKTYPPEFTPQQAADLLNVSVTYLERLLASGELPSAATETQCRIRLADLLEYRARSDAQRRQALEDLAREAQKLGSGY